MASQAAPKQVERILMTPHEAEAIVARLRYKPNHKFEVMAPCLGMTAHIDCNRFVVGLTGYVPDSVGNFAEIPVVNFQSLRLDQLEAMSVRHFVGWIKTDIIRPFEEHEIDEWYKFDDLLLHDPHAMVQERHPALDLPVFNGLSALVESDDATYANLSRSTR